MDAAQLHAAHLLQKAMAGTVTADLLLNGLKASTRERFSQLGDERFEAVWRKITGDSRLRAAAEIAAGQIKLIAEALS